MTEEKYLELVIEKLKTKIAQIDDKMQGNEKDIESMHDYFWENYTEFDEYGYERQQHGTQEPDYGAGRVCQAALPF